MPTKRLTLDRHHPAGAADLARIAATSEQEIERQAAEDDAPDIATGQWRRVRPWHGSDISSSFLFSRKAPNGEEVLSWGKLRDDG